VKFADGALRVFVSRHLNERESPSPTGCHVAHDPDIFDRASTAEQAVQIFIRRAIGKVANIEPTTHTAVIS
jgi:hypothetical protein